MQAEMLDSTISNSLQLFADKGFKLRVIIRGGNPWFVASDACGCLTLSNVSEALADLDDDDKLKLTKDELDTLISREGIKCSVDSRVQTLNLVSESGLYDLIMQSRKPEAKAFKRWVTHEVLPSIRKTGKYEAHPTVPSYMLKSEEERAIAWAEEHKQARLALEAKEREIKSLQAQKDVLMQDYMSLKGFCNGLIAKGLAVQTNGKPYVIGTLRTKLSPILQTVSAKFRYSISEETVVVDGVERKTPYYHKDVCKMVENVITPQWLRCPDVSIITDEI